MHFKKVHHAQTAARSHPSCTRGLHAKTMGKDNHAPGQHSTRRMSSAPPGVPTADNSRYEYLLVTLHEGVRTITFNRPDKKNSLNEKVYYYYFFFIVFEIVMSVFPFPVLVNCGRWSCWLSVQRFQDLSFLLYGRLWNRSFGRTAFLVTETYHGFPH